MGLDLALAGLVLIAAIRGWLKGFVLQAIRLSGLVASVYVAVPLRDQVKPYAIEYLPTMRPDLVDRLLWWGSAALAYVVMVGVAKLIVSASRRQSYGVAEPNRGDQFAGLGLGVLKGALVASFVVAGLSRYGQEHLTKIDWAQGQTKESYAWEWNERFHPAARIWASAPVQQFVSHVQQMGIMAPQGTPTEPHDEPEKEKPVQTASRAPKLMLEKQGGSTPHGSNPSGDEQATLEELQGLLRQLESLR